MTFSEPALAEAAERGGGRTCPACEAKCLFYGFRYERNGDGLIEVVWCPSCRESPVRRPWRPRQLKLEV